MNQDIKHKFKPGDVVKIIGSGYGCSSHEVGKISIIQECGTYIRNDPGYRINPKYGNSRTNNFKGFISERSFILLASYTSFRSCKR